VAVRQFEHLSNYSDDDLFELICSAQNGNKESVDRLVKIYAGMTIIKAQPFNNVAGYEVDDFISAGYDGILDAIKGFNPLHYFNITAFFDTCIYNQMIDLYRKAKAKNKLVFVQDDVLVKVDDVYEPLVNQIYEDDGRNWIKETDTLDKKMDFLLTALPEELSQKVRISLRQAEIFILWLSGKKYQEIAFCLYGVNTDTKVKTNLFRAKQRVCQWVKKDFSDGI